MKRLIRTRRTTTAAALALLVSIVGASFGGSVAEASPAEGEHARRSVASETIRFRDYVTLPTGRQLWVEADIIDPKLPTQIIFNGLTNSTGSFVALTSEFNRRNFNVIRFDFNGQARSLLATRDLDRDLTVEKQVADVKALIPLVKKKFDLEGPLDILGQSYGGGILLATLGLEPEFSAKNFRSVTAFAPYTEPLRDQDKQIKQEMEFYKPFLGKPLSDADKEKLYDRIHRRMVFSSYWILEPEVLQLNPFDNPLVLDGIFELTRGIRKMSAETLLDRFPKMRVNIVMSLWDQYIPGDVIPRFWKVLPADKKGVFIQVDKVEHKMLQMAPILSADIMDATRSGAFKPGTELKVVFGKENAPLKTAISGVMCERLFGK